jgi:protease-4
MKTPEEYQIKALKKEIFISNLKVAIIVILLLLEIGAVVIFLAKSGIMGKKYGAGDSSIALIHFDKEITEAYVSKVMDKMDEIRQDPSYKAVLFVMSSPGGSPAASEEMASYLSAYTQEKNVTMYVESIAASGGYYIASAIRPLYANQNAIVGSIGVIMPHYDLGELAKKVGVAEDNLVQGTHKQPVSMFKKIDTNNRQYLTDHLLKPMYENFLTSVSKYRGVNIDTLRPFAEGKVYLANDPKIKGILVDEVSTLHRIRTQLKKQYGDSVSFETIPVEKKLPFLPEIKVDLGLESVAKMLRF